MPVIIPVKFKLKGHFHLTAINVDTGEERVVADFDNLIVNQGLDFIATGGPGTGTANCIYYGCVVGTGTSPVSPTDTHLQTFLAGTLTTIASGVTYNPGPSYTVVSSTTYQFGTGVAAGNLTEIGIVAPASGQTLVTVPTSTSPLFSHSLILVGGSPGTITILANETLNVVYTITASPIVTTLTGSFNLNTDGTITSVNYSLLSASVGTSGTYAITNTQRNLVNTNSPASSAAYPSGASLGLPTGNPTGTAASLTGATVVQASYTTGNYFLSYTVSVPIGGANTTSASIAAITFGIGLNTTPLQMTFSPAIAKSTSQTFSYIVNVSWSN